MTSKEAMLELLGFIAFQVPIEKQEEWKEMLNAIQKDLDRLEKQDKILELLKKRIASKDEYHITFRINACFKNEYDLIMDWVNNNGK